MATVYLHQMTARLDSLFKSVDSIGDDEIKAHLARYLCVLTSGYLEVAVKSLIGNYVASHAHKDVTNFVNSETKNLTNLNINKICSLLSCFNSCWMEEFEKVITDEEKAAIDSIVANRHLIAHGQNVGVSYVNIKDWYKNTKCVVEKLRIIIIR